MPKYCKIYIFETYKHIRRRYTGRDKAHLRAGSYYSRPVYIKNDKRGPGNAPQTRRAWIYYFCKKYFWPKP